MPLDDDTKKELAARDLKIKGLEDALGASKKSGEDMAAQIGNLTRDLGVVTNALKKGTGDGNGTGGNGGSGGDGKPDPALAKGAGKADEGRSGGAGGGGDETEFRLFPIPGLYRKR